MLIHEKLTYRLNGIFFKIQNTFGKVLREKQYGDLVAAYLQEMDIPYEREVVLSAIGPVTGNVADFVIDKRIVLEIKTKPHISKQDYLQLKRYLLAAKLKLGILVNFWDDRIKPLRVINSHGCLAQNRDLAIHDLHKIRITSALNPHIARPRDKRSA